MDDKEYFMQVVSFGRAAQAATENWQSALDILLDAAALIAEENKVPAFQAFERFQEAHQCYTDASEMVASGQRRKM